MPTPAPASFVCVSKESVPQLLFIVKHHHSSHADLWFVAARLYISADILKLSKHQANSSQAQPHQR